MFDDWIEAKMSYWEQEVEFGPVEITEEQLAALEHEKMPF